MALLSLRGYDGLGVRRDSFVSFRYLGRSYETVRQEGRICVGLCRDVYSDEEFESALKAGEEMMAGNPDLQCFFSVYDRTFKLRLWVPCPMAADFDAVLTGGLDTLTESVEAEFEQLVQRHVFELAAPAFNAIVQRKQ